MNHTNTLLQLQLTDVTPVSYNVICCQNKLYSRWHELDRHVSVDLKMNNYH